MFRLQMQHQWKRKRNCWSVTSVTCLSCWPWSFPCSPHTWGQTKRCLYTHHTSNSVVQLIPLQNGASGCVASKHSSTRLFGTRLRFNKAPLKRQNLPRTNATSSSLQHPRLPHQTTSFQILRLMLKHTAKASNQKSRGLRYIAQNENSSKFI